MANLPLPSRLIRLPLRLIPRNAVMRVLAGPARGAKWVAGASNHGCWIGTYEREAQTALARFIRPEGVLYDIGANVGFYTVLAARRGAKVHAFEPDPANLKVLRNHIALNAIHHVTVHEAAVSDAEGRARFTPDGSMGHLSASGIEVPTVALDGLVARGMEPPTVIKMDVEGAELSVLRGATHLLERYRPAMVCSLHGKIDNGVDVDTECLKILRSLGYRCTRMCHGDWVCEPDRDEA